MKKKQGWGGGQSNSHGHLGASGSGAESQGCCQHEHSDLEEKSTCVLPLGPHDEATQRTAKKPWQPSPSWPKCYIPTSKPAPG